MFEWCAGTTRGVPLALEEGSSPFLETVRHPVPAAGALARVKSAMGNPEHYKQVHAAANTAAYLHVVSEICKAPASAWRGSGDGERGDWRHGQGRERADPPPTLDVAVELVELGLVGGAARGVREVETPAAGVRYFAGEVLEVAGPGQIAMDLLSVVCVGAAARGQRRQRHDARVDEFLEQCCRQRARGIRRCSRR